MHYYEFSGQREYKSTTCVCPFVRPSVSYTYISEINERIFIKFG